MREPTEHSVIEQKLERATGASETYRHRGRVFDDELSRRIDEARVAVLKSGAGRDAIREARVELASAGAALQSGQSGEASRYVAAAWRAVGMTDPREEGQQ